MAEIVLVKSTKGPRSTNIVLGIGAFFAVTETLKGGLEKGLGRYTLTHLPTGWAVAMDDDPSELANLATLLAGFDWDFKDPRKAIPMRSAKRVVDEWNARRGAHSDLRCAR